MKAIEFTKQQQVKIAKKFQDNYVYNSLKKNSNNNKISHELSQTINKELASSIVTGTKQYSQAMLATTGTVENDGDAFISHGLQTDVITERITYNPLLPYISMTQGRLDEAVRLITTIDDDELIEDGEVAKDLSLKGAVVSFKQFKGKYFADMSETVELGTSTNLSDKVMQSLASALSKKELKLMFDTNVKEEHEHMNFYKNDIQAITGADLYQAINNSINSFTYFF